MEQKYDVFISYSRKDYVDENKNVIPGNVVSKIKDALSDAGISYWFDEEGINHGDDFVEKIVTHIEQSDIFLYISSANANKSSWTCKEIASADEMKKHIIPIRIDKSKYNAKVLFRIADLDYIEYYTNEEKALQELVDSIKAYLDNLKIEKQQREEELQRLLQKREKEQKELIAHIENSLKKLDNEEKKIELERSNLVLDIEKVLDEEKKVELTELAERKDEIIPEDTKQLLDENRYLKKENFALKKDIIKTKKELEKNQASDGSFPTTNTKKIHVFYIVLFVLLLLGCLIGIGNLDKQKREWEYACFDKEFELNKKEDLLAQCGPFVISDVEVKNYGENWGDTIYSKKSTYFVPRFKYVGIQEGTYEIEVNVYDKKGLRSGSNREYSYRDKVNIKEGSRVSDDITGWGGDTKGHWSSGLYRIEIWYQGKIMASKRFEVY